MNTRKQELRSPIADFMALSDAEKERVVSEFDRPFVADTFRPLTPGERQRWQRIKRKLGRPKVGAGVKVIAVSIEENLLRRTDALAKKQKMSRAALIARALETILAKAG